MEKIKIDQSLDPDRIDFLREVKAQDREVDELLDKLSDDIKKAVKNTSRTNEIQDKDRLNSLLNSAFTTYFAGLSAVMIRHNNLVNKKQYDYEVQKLIKQYPSQDVVPLARRIYEEQSKFDLMDRIMEGRKVGSRIVTLKGETLKVAQSIVEVGIRNNKSAIQIARDLDRYIQNKGNFISPLQWVRERYERIRPSVLNRVPRGSVSFNSYRIARTEINMTYRNATIQANYGKPWFQAFNWYVSKSHPKKDVCDDIQANNPHKVPPDDPHPFCMCKIETVFKDYKDIKWG